MIFLQRSKLCLIFVGLCDLQIVVINKVERKWGVGFEPPLEFDILQMLYYLRKGEYLFLYTFCLFIVDLTQISQNEFA